MDELEHLAMHPQIDPSAFVACSADIEGDVRIGANSSVWFQCVLRGDINTIEIGRNSNLQDGAIVHVSSSHPAVIGDRVSCGHRAIVHACTIQDDVLIGMGAIVMDEARVGNQVIIGAGSVVTKGTIIPDGVLMLGSPARVARDLTHDELQSIPKLAQKYVKVAAAHRSLPSDQAGSENPAP